MGKLKFVPFDQDAFLAISSYDEDWIAFVKELPTAQRGYVPTRKSWWINYDFLLEARDVGTEYFDAVDWSSLDEQYRVALGDKIAKPEPPPRGDHATLFLIAGAPPEVVKAAYRALALLHHPDRGGDAAKMKAVTAAYARLSGKG